MELFWHILDRGSIHFTASTTLVLMVAVLIRLRAKYSKWLPKSLTQTLVLSALIVFVVATLREAYDVSNGQPLIKAFTDYISWLLGTGVGAWGLYRFRYFSWEDQG